MYPKHTLERSCFVSSSVTIIIIVIIGMKNVTDQSDVTKEHCMDS